MALSSGIPFYQIYQIFFSLNFEKRDFILVGASILFMLGLSPFIGMAYALAIAFLVYFGIKVFVGRRKRQIQKETGYGICADCGANLDNKKCPNCTSKDL